MKALDLFSGIGGFSLGLQRAGVETIGFCEIDPTARRVLRKHWPTTPIFQDIKTLKATDLPEMPQVICGGFPCQDISKAGEGLGLSGERSGLWVHYKRLIEEIKPKYVLIENVATLRSRGLARVLKDLWEIGYDSEWHIIPASCVGLPHARERLWIIAYPTSQLIQEPILQRSLSFSSQPQKPRFSDGWISEWLATWIRRRVVQRGHGIPRALASDALKQYGNAVVPQIPEIIGKEIIKHESKRTNTRAAKIQTRASGVRA